VTSAGGRERQAGLVPAIHVFSAGWEGMDGRDKRGHDDLRPFIIPVKHAPRYWVVSPRQALHFVSCSRHDLGRALAERAFRR
jgi:hypothetical protein